MNLTENNVTEDTAAMRKTASTTVPKSSNKGRMMAVCSWEDDPPVLRPSAAKSAISCDAFTRQQIYSSEAHLQWKTGPGWISWLACGRRRQFYSVATHDANCAAA